MAMVRRRDLFKTCQQQYKATWVAETVRVAVDQKRLADEQPEIFKAYAKESKISASVRILSPRA